MSNFKTISKVLVLAHPLLNIWCNSNNKCFLIDISPDIKYQLKMIRQNVKEFSGIFGIFITHAHYGHYMGLLELGLEVMNTNHIPVYVMPRMKLFLENNKPFEQLITLKNNL